MLRIFINKGNIKMEAEGTGRTLTAEVLAIIGAMYKKLGESDDDAAEHFKRIIKSAINDDVPFKSTEDALTEILSDKQSVVNFIDFLRRELRKADD